MTEEVERRIKVVEILEATTGGTRRHLSDLVTHIDKSRFAVAVICSTLRDRAFLKSVEQMKAAGVTVHDIPMVRSITPLRDLVAFCRIWRYIRSENPDIVHTHSSKAGFLGRLAARLAGAPCILHSPHLYAFEMETTSILKAFFFRLEQIASKLTDLTVCVSPSERDTAITYSLASADTCEVVMNGVAAPDLLEIEEQRAAKREELGLSDDHLVIGSVGRFTRQKGLPYFLDAAQALAESVPNARFVLVGNGELHADLEQSIKQRGLSNKCTALVREDGFHEFYPLFDIFVLTSLWEGMPYAILEAMAAGRPIVAFRTGGIGDVIADGCNGLLVETRNTDALISAISTLAREPKKREDLANSALSCAAAEHRVADMVTQIERLYTKAANDA